MKHLELYEGTHYTSRTRAGRLALISSSEEYFRLLDRAITAAKRRILVVGWSFDDRIVLVRDNAESLDIEPSGCSLGELLVQRARQNPELRIQLRIWRAPAVFGADQHITSWFQEQAQTLENLELVRVTSTSAFSARHEKFVIIDDAIAWIGGIDLSHNRWDTEDHIGDDLRRINPDGERYVAYHDTQLMLTGPVVRDLFEIAIRDRLVDDDWDPVDTDLWPSEVPVDLYDAEVALSRTRSYPEHDGDDVHQIAHLYRDLLNAAERRIYIENQYFSSDEITETVISRLHEPEGPEIIILISRELPDTLGRVTMGANSALRLSQLLENDRYDRLGIFFPVAVDGVTGTGAVKVHSKTMVIDGSLVTLGSANISRRSFSLDAELNVTILGAGAAGGKSGRTDGGTDGEADDETGNGTSTRTDERTVDDRPAWDDRLLAHHAGMEIEEWETLVSGHSGSRLSALRERVQDWPGLQDGRAQVITDAPKVLPPTVIERFDMKEPPPQETVLQRIARSNPLRIISRTRRVWIISILGILAIAALFYAARTDFDIHAFLGMVEQINDEHPVAGVLLTVASFWITMIVFVTIVVPVVFFSALHGPLLGIVYSTLGIFTGAALFYGIGLALHNNPWPDRYQAVRRVKEQLNRIKPYGLWAVAISRIVPSGPFLVVNLVTGLLGFSPGQFLAGSAIGLFPGIIAFSVFGEVIRNVFSDPGLMNTIWFVLFLVAYFAAVRGLIFIVRRVAGWGDTDSDE
ncbi:MAG: phospholipase D-like domain-containing protein [Alkalispirochaeta sp.]